LLEARVATADAAAEVADLTGLARRVAAATVLGIGIGVDAGRTALLGPGRTRALTGDAGDTGRARIVAAATAIGVVLQVDAQIAAAGLTGALDRLDPLGDASDVVLG